MPHIISRHESLSDMIVAVKFFVYRFRWLQCFDISGQYCLDTAYYRVVISLKNSSHDCTVMSLKHERAAVSGDSSVSTASVDCRFFTATTNFSVLTCSANCSLDSISEQHFHESVSGLYCLSSFQRLQCIHSFKGLWCQQVQQTLPWRMTVSIYPQWTEEFW